MSVDIEKRNFFLVHKLLDEWRERYSAPAFSEMHLIALQLIILFFFFPLSLSHLATGAVAVIDSIYCLIASVAFKKNPGLQAQF